MQAHDTERFEALLNSAEDLGPRSQSFAELRELARLYRAHAARLARLRDRGMDPDAVRHLNALCVRAFTRLNVEPLRETPGPTLRERVAKAIAESWPTQTLAWGLLILGLAIGAGLGARDAEILAVMVPFYSTEVTERLVASKEAREQFLAREKTPVAQNLLFGSYLFANNTRVGLLSFATGILAGIPTVILQFYNGVMIGGFTSIFLRDPWPIGFLAWILPHGVPELTAITLCAAAGLHFGRAVAAPGRRSRRRAIREAAFPALLLFGTSVPLFFAAALVESFIRESALGTTPRLAVAALFVALLGWGLLAARRIARRQRVETSWLADLS